MFNPTSHGHQIHAMRNASKRTLCKTIQKVREKPVTELICGLRKLAN
jgi:hypothetical protein